MATITGTPIIRRAEAVADPSSVLMPFMRRMLRSCFCCVDVEAVELPLPTQGLLTSNQPPVDPCFCAEPPPSSCHQSNSCHVLSAFLSLCAAPLLLR